MLVKMPNVLIRPLLLACILFSVCRIAAVQAETAPVVIQPNDTLGAIVRQAYPGYRNRAAIMQLILERNPEAFRNNNINLLIIGRTLVLPDANELPTNISPAVSPSAPVQVNSETQSQSQSAQLEQADTQAEQQLKNITQERDQLQSQLQQLESDNEGLQSAITRLETLKDEQDVRLETLTEQIETLQRAAQERIETVQTNQAQATQTELQQQISQAEDQRTQVQSQLEALQARYDAITTENKTLSDQLAELKQEQLQSAPAVTADTAETVSSGAEQAGINADLQQKIEELQTAIQSLENDKNTLQQQIEALKSSSERLKLENTQLQTQSKTLSAQTESLQSLTAEKSAVEAEKVVLQEQLDSSVVATEKLEADNKLLQEQLDKTVGSVQELEADNKALQTRLDSSSEATQALVNAQKTLQEKATAAQADNAQLTIDNTDLQQQISVLQQDSEILREDNARLQLEIDDAKILLASSNEETQTLRTELAALNGRNTALQTEIEQIRAAASSDVTLTPVEPVEKSYANLWPWLLALLLLPVAWFLGQRSRPAAPIFETARVIDSSADMPLQTDAMGNTVVASNDPVMPVLTSESMASNAEAITVPDDPDVAIKLDMAHAYLDLRDSEAANDVLQEVIREGGTQQQQEAKEILSFIN